MTLTFVRRYRSTLSAIALLTAGWAPTTAISEQVNLRSDDGTINLSGEFIDFSDDHYVIRTALGEFRISAARVRCEGDACPTFETEAADLVFVGSDTLGQGLMPLLLSGYASYLDAEAAIKATGRDGEIIADLIGEGGFGDEIGTVLVTSTSSNNSFESLLAKEAMIGMSSRRIQPAEARALRDNGAGNMVSPNQEHIVAVDSLVVITHPSNAVAQISVEQLQDIYSGRVRNWKEIGGEDAPITVINRQQDSGTRSIFENGVFGQAAPVSSSQTIAENNNTMASLVNGDPNAIGYVGYAFQRGAKALSLVNECGMQTDPDAFSAKVEEYALQRRLYLYNRADQSADNVTDFLTFATSEYADGVIAKSGFIDLGVARKRQQMDGGRARALLDPNADAFEGGVMREMLSEMLNYDRLSTTFRFRTGSSNLDERAQIDMKRLVDFLELQPNGTKLLFVGFTDDVGPFESNRALSVKRSEQVARELREFGKDRLAGIEIAVSGYGEIAPSACNSSEKGRSVNRRVEVWIESAPES